MPTEPYLYFIYPLYLVAIIAFSLEDSEGRTEKPAIKIGEVMVKRR